MNIKEWPKLSWTPTISVHQKHAYLQLFVLVLKPLIGVLSIGGFLGGVSQNCI